MLVGGNVALGVAVAPATPPVGEGEWLGTAVPAGEPVGVAVGVADAAGLGVAVALGTGVGLGLGVALGVDAGVGLGVALGVGLGVALVHVDPTRTCWLSAYAAAWKSPLNWTTARAVNGYVPAGSGP